FLLVSISTVDSVLEFFLFFWSDRFSSLEIYRVFSDLLFFFSWFLMRIFSFDFSRFLRFFISWFLFISFRGFSVSSSIGFSILPSIGFSDSSSIGILRSSPGRFISTISSLISVVTDSVLSLSPPSTSVGFESLRLVNFTFLLVSISTVDSVLGTSSCSSER
ncbi:hypothetical protein SSS_10609, partial [Sarcoptes scabiei]